jgi:oligopeptide/dipeptide ABC transporter ATP-binding protein
MIPSMGGSLLAVEALSIEFRLGRQWAPAVNDISFTLAPGEIVGLVGESGSGKSVTSLAIMGLLPGKSACRVSGRILFNDQDLLALREREIRRLRGDVISMVFQDPMTSLNPVLTVGSQIAEAVRAHRRVSPGEAWARAVAGLKEVGIRDADVRARQYPHQFSGGMRQRAMLAMAFACEPRLVLADEPTTALDVTVQRQVLDVMRRLQRERGTTVLLITHDLGVVAEVCDRLMVMYGGRILEVGPVAQVLSSPKQPYTQALLRSLPETGDGRQRRLDAIGGQPPDLAHIPPGCPFHPRCPRVIPGTCDLAMPSPVSSGGQTFHCWATARDMGVEPEPLDAVERKVAA